METVSKNAMAKTTIDNSVLSSGSMVEFDKNDKGMNIGHI